MPVTSNDIANQAIQMIGDNQPPVTGVAPTFDTSPAGKALASLYAPCVATVLRSFGWDFARRSFTLALTGGAAPLGYAFEYLYPPFALEIWQLVPPVLGDPNDPLPQTWTVGNTLVATVQTKVIWSSLAGALAILNNNPTESTWDAGVREAVVRMLASELAMAISGRPDTEQALLNSSRAAAAINQARSG